MESDRQHYTQDEVDTVIKNESQIKGLDTSPQNGSTDAVIDVGAILDSVEQLDVHQHLDVVEVCLCWERNNRYSINDKFGKQILYAYEAAQCYNRQCYGSLQELTMYLTDNHDNRLLRLDRPLRCSSRMCYACCCLQEITITTMTSNQVLGTLKEKWTCLRPRYVLEDEQGNEKFHFVGGASHCRICCDIHFTVQVPTGEEVAFVHKFWGGCKGIIGASNDFSVTYLDGLSGEEKATILGAIFLLDFNYFERHGKCF